ncbi:hypothetical protein PAL_GLEAN10021741 [Pteropus alecto]|uniref:Uncharacterized protein n=1 Tax=Pteropus alecto TaxID=9402 RepID=L5KLU9_PTEAL|nr:hypothetical protein PAL_GLEAN10021741 [Pteropus alecto]
MAINLLISERDFLEQLDSTWEPLSSHILHPIDLQNELSWASEEADEAAEFVLAPAATPGIGIGLDEILAS